jgi:hypothetical protein
MYNSQTPLDIHTVLTHSCSFRLNYHPCVKKINDELLFCGNLDVNKFCTNESIYSLPINRLDEITLDNHTCVQEKCRPVRWFWCGNISGVCERQILQEINQKICDDNETKRIELEKLGHRCVFIQDSIPSKLSWCNKEICNNISKNLTN